MYARFVPRVPRKAIAIEVTHSPIILTLRARFTAPLCQACKAVITRHVVSVGQTATGASSRFRLISAGDSIAFCINGECLEKKRNARDSSSCRGIRQNFSRNSHSMKYLDS